MTQAAPARYAVEDAPLVDAWSRRAPKYRVQAIVMLVVLGLLFAGLCCFAYWLRTGVLWPWTHDGYGSLMLRSLSIRGREQITLNDFLTYPISVQRVPVHGITMGLLFASLTSIPILVGILYRFPFSVILAAMVAFLAALPWLGITVLLGCAVASLRPFRMSFRYASALLGLIPIAIYFVSASLEPTGTALATGVRFRALLYAPWVLAVLSSCVICAVALGIARLIGYRAGGIPPLLAVLFAIPVLLFHTKVGRSELEYRILEREVGPGSRVTFVASSLNAEAHREATALWNASPHESYDDVFARVRTRLIDRAKLDAEAQRAEAVARCDAFMEEFSTSRLIPSVLYLKGRCLDMRLHALRLQREHYVEYDAEFPGDASRGTWEALVEHFPDSEVTALALYKLAVIETRAGRLDEAIELLLRFRKRFDDLHAGASAAAQQRARGGSMFARASAAEGLGVDRAVIALHTRRMQELLEDCRNDARRPYFAVLGPRRLQSDATLHPLQLYFSFDETDPHYVANLTGLIAAFPDSQTAGFAEIRRALQLPSISQRIARIRQVLAAQAGRAAEAEALYQLAEELREEGDVLGDDAILNEARQYWDTLIKNHPKSAWSREAQERLASMTVLEAVRRR